MRWPALIALLGACGFTGGVPADAPTDERDPAVDTDRDSLVDPVDNCPTIANVDQRDWDADDHGDVCDGCPHLADSTDPDRDGDHVGDACDPFPDAATESRLAWLGFWDGNDIAGWRNTNETGVWFVEDFALQQRNTTTGLALLDTPTSEHGNVYFATRAEIVAFDNALDEIGFCGGNVQPGIQYYCCAVRGTGEVRAAYAWSGSPGQQQAAQPWPDIATGSMVDIVGQMTATGMQCTFAGSSQGADIQVAQRGPMTPGSPTFYTSTTAAKFHYAFVVATP